MHENKNEQNTGTKTIKKIGKATYETMKRTTKIEAVKENPKRKLRVAAYARVSTESDKQLVSLEAQKNHYETYIKARPDWEYAGLYFDEGVSGTKMAKRDGLLSMLEDCDRGLIDLIIVKSISRFSRNTVDCLKYTRELKALNIAVYFEKENINTLASRGEVLMTIMAALAQQESESISANVRLGIQFRNQQGKVRVNHNRFLGYTKDDEGKLIIVPEEELKAAIVEATNDAFTNRDSVLPMLKENIEDVIGGSDTDRISAVNQKIKEKQTELLKAGQDEEQTERIGDEILNLREEKHKIMMASALKQEQIERMEDMMAFLDKQVKEITKYSEALVRRLVEKITIYDEKLVVEFKSGLEIEVDG